MGDSNAIDAALITKLRADATLLGYCPDGVYWDEAPPGAIRFVIVSLVDEDDVQQFGGRAIENALYAVKAVAFSTSGTDPTSAAAARIDAVLNDQPLTMGSPPTPVTGYGWMTTHREARIRQTEVDDADAAIRWYHRGGHYRVMMSVT